MSSRWSRCMSSRCHHPSSGGSNSPCGTSQTRLSSTGTSHSSPSCSASSWTSRSSGNSGGALVTGGRALHCHAHDVLTPEQHQTQHSLLLPLHGLGGLRLQLSELLAVAQDHVHVLVKCLKLSNEGSAILEDDSH